jgi:hypothetical protein
MIEGWCLDTSATHHMTDQREFFTELDSSVRGSVKFGDASSVEIKGVGSVVFTAASDEHRLLTEVYYILALRNSIISLGQLDENGSRVEVKKSHEHLGPLSSPSCQGTQESKSALHPQCEGGTTLLPCFSSGRRGMTVARAFRAS